ncbi:MAG: hypothetical protein ACHRHE_01080 [Tepidisphaerales bacterium]
MNPRRTTTRALYLALILLSCGVRHVAADAAGGEGVKEWLKTAAFGNEWPMSTGMRDGVLPEIRFDAIPLADVVDFMRDVTSIKVVVDWAALQEAGVTKATPVTIKLRDASIGAVLSAILKSIETREPLDFTLEEKLIRITTAAHLHRELVARAYDVRDLLAGSSDARAEDKPRRAKALTDLIESTVAPAAWTKGSTIREIDGRLAVVASLPTHRQLAGLLDELRNSLAIRVEVGVKVATVTRAMLKRNGAPWHLDVPRAGTASTMTIGESAAASTLDALKSEGVPVETTTFRQFRSGQAATCYGNLWQDGTADPTRSPRRAAAGQSIPVLEITPAVGADRQTIVLRVRPRVLFQAEPKGRLLGDMRVIVTLPHAGFAVIALPEDPERPLPPQNDDHFFLFIVHAALGTAPAEAR